MRRSAGRTVLAGLIALLLGVSALGPCDCLVSAAASHCTMETPDAHPCCETPAGVRALSNECCDCSPELVLASTAVPELAPPLLQAGHVRLLRSGEESMPVAVVRTLQPLPPDRTTVLLI
jgi:hypothetical protein